MVTVGRVRHKLHGNFSATFKPFGQLYHFGETFLLWGIVNRGKWLSSLEKFFVQCFCSLFGPNRAQNTTGPD